MKFTLQKSEWYPEFWISDNKKFAVAVSLELFGRLKINVMHAGEKEDQWYVIQFYVTYHEEVKNMQIQLIFEKLASLETDEWQKVEEKIPYKYQKYLDDEGRSV